MTEYRLHGSGIRILEAGEMRWITGEDNTWIRGRILKAKCAGFGHPEGEMYWFGVDQIYRWTEDPYPDPGGILEAK